MTEIIDMVKYTRDIQILDCPWAEGPRLVEQSDRTLTDKSRRY